MGESRVIPAGPPRLKARLEYFRAELPSFQPVYDRVFVYPLDTYGQPDKTAGGIIIADSTKRRLAAQVGLLVAAGIKAREELYSHGIELGDIVLLARFSHWERGYFSKDKLREHRVSIVQAGEIVASEDLKSRMDSGDVWMEMDQEGKTTFHDREGERDRTDPPQIDLGDGV